MPKVIQDPHIHDMVNGVAFTRTPEGFSVSDDEVDGELLSQFLAVTGFRRGAVTQAYVPEQAPAQDEPTAPETGPEASTAAVEQAAEPEQAEAPAVEPEAAEPAPAVEPEAAPQALEPEAQAPAVEPEAPAAAPAPRKRKAAAEAPAQPAAPEGGSEVF